MLVAGNNFHINIIETADILKAVTNLVDHEGHVMSGKNCKVICMFLPVNPVTSATDEKAFSMARRVILLRANIMNQHEVLSCGYIASQ